MMTDVMIENEIKEVNAKLDKEYGKWEFGKPITNQEKIDILEKYLNSLKTILQLGGEIENILYTTED